VFKKITKTGDDDQIVPFSITLQLPHRHTGAWAIMSVADWAS